MMVLRERCIPAFFADCAKRLRASGATGLSKTTFILGSDRYSPTNRTMSSLVKRTLSSSRLMRVSMPVDFGRARGRGQIRGGAEAPASAAVAHGYERSAAQ